jgi:hypothetical protein
MFIVQTPLLCCIRLYMVYVLYFYAIFGTRHMSIECTFQVANHMSVYVTHVMYKYVRFVTENVHSMCTYACIHSMCTIVAFGMPFVNTLKIHCVCIL